MKNPLKQSYLNKKKHPIAKYLKDRRDRQLVIKNKKVYNRKRSNHGQFKSTNPKIMDGA